MGADIYLRSEFDANKAIWEPKFHEAVRRRDRAIERDKVLAARTGRAPKSFSDSAEQKEVMEAYEAMMSKGYFRDSYNAGAFLWVIGLSWWKDVGDMLTRKGKYAGCLSIPRAKKLLKMIEDAPLTLETVKAHMEAQNAKNPDTFTFTETSGTPEQWLERWQQKKADLTALLRRSIELKEPLRCSI